MVTVVCLVAAPQSTRTSSKAEQNTMRTKPYVPTVHAAKNEKACCYTTEFLINTKQSQQLTNDSVQLALHYSYTILPLSLCSHPSPLYYWSLWKDSDGMELNGPGASEGVFLDGGI